MTGMEMILQARCPIVLLLFAGLTLSACGRKPRTWTERFPELAPRVPHFEERMASGDDEARERVLKELTYFQPRDSRLYPPFLQALLEETTGPKLCGEILQRLHEHMIFPAKEDLPEAFRIPWVGDVRPRDANSIQVARWAAARPLGGPHAGWGVLALAIAQDKESVELARRVLESPNVFERFRGAHALLVFGETDAAVEAFIDIIRNRSNDDSRYYQGRSAETLVRLGHREYLYTLLELEEQGRRSTQSYFGLLADLTGEFYPTSAGWRRWLKQQKIEMPGTGNSQGLSSTK